MGSICETISRHAPRFLGNQDRRKKLKKLLVANDDEIAIDLKMMAVLVGSDVAHLFSILSALCDGHMQRGHVSLSEVPQALVQFEKMGLEERFWHFVEETFGYTHETPTLGGLLRCLFVSEFFHQTGGVRVPPWLISSCPGPVVRMGWSA